MTTLSVGAWYRTLFAKTAQIHMRQAHETLFNPDCPSCGQIMAAFAYAQSLGDEELESVIAQS